MSRKWIVLVAVAMVSVAFVITRASTADDDEGPLHALMEKVNKTSLSIKKAVRTQAAFEKASDGKDVASLAEDLVKFASQAKEIKDAAKQAKDVPKPLETWNTLMESLIKSGDEVARAAKEGDYLATKAAYNTMAKQCAPCHDKFKKDADAGAGF
jgi:cytochrome c556